MTKKEQDTFNVWLKFFIGLLAIVAIKSIFQNDDSKIVSKKGKQLLSDEKSMKKLNKKIHKSEQENSYNEIFI